MTALPFAFALCLFGFAALALAMPRHARQIGSGPAVSVLALRGAATVAFLGAAVICVTLWDVPRGMPIAIGLASLAAITVGLLLSFAPNRLVAVALAGPLLAGLLALWN